LKTRAVIFGAAPNRDWRFLQSYLRPDDVIICADGGQKVALALGLTPDWYVGDSDSGGCAGDCPADLLPSEKDVTDLDMAISRALRLGAQELLLCGCTGGREDHHLSAIGQLERIHRAGAQALLLDDTNEIRLLTRGSITLPTQPEYPYFGIIPLDATLKDVTIQGAKYPVSHVDFERWTSLGVSNEPLPGQSCTITVGQGIGLLIRSR
jgi:thiamine pyrophosphokinase